MNDEISCPVSESQSSYFPWPTQIVECKPHIPWRLTVVDDNLVDTFRPHANHVLNAQPAFEGRLVNLYFDQSLPCLIMYTILTSFRVHNTDSLLDCTAATTDSARPNGSRARACPDGQLATQVPSSKLQVPSTTENAIDHLM